MTDLTIPQRPAAGRGADDLNPESTLRDTLVIIWRGLVYVKYYWVRFTAKISLNLAAMAIYLAMPWLGKMVVDHVILGQPVAGAYYPWFANWFAEFIAGRSPVEMMAWIMGLGAVMMVTVGNSGASAGNDSVEGNLSSGYDTATRSENEANYSHSNGGGLLGMLEFWVQLRLAQSMNHLVRSQLFESIKSLPMRSLDDQRIGDTVYRVMYDTSAISLLFFKVIEGPIKLTFMFTNTCLIFIGAYTDAPLIIWLVILSMPFQLFAVIIFSHFLRRTSRASRTAGAATTANIEEGMSNVLAVQSLGGNRRELGRFEDDSRESFRRFRIFMIVEIIVQRVGRLAGNVAEWAIWYVTVMAVIEGTLTVGDFAVVALYYRMLLRSAGSLPYTWVMVQDNAAGMHRVFTLFDAPKEQTVRGIELPEITDGVRMQEAGLTYADGREALKNINLTANVGEIIALVGPTGAGKTSLAHLIPGYYLPTTGTVRIDGYDISEISLDSLRCQVSYVFQETQLFSDSVADNIRYGAPDVTQDEIEHAARVAGAHDFIMELPDGYDTRLGTVTSKLSVGQKQRIAIARGLVKDARILILDEPTSALDPDTEAYLVSALQEAARSRLVLVIAHRLSTIAHTDRIYFIDDGEILEQGSHTELMAIDDGHYRRYVSLQSATGGS